MSTNNKEAAERVLNVGARLANVAFNWAQLCGHTLTSDDCAILDKLRKEWDEARRSALTASEAPATEQAPPLPDCVAWGVMKRGDRVWYINDSRFTCEGYAQHYAHRDAHGVDQNVIPVFTADQVQTYAEQYAAWKIAALRSEQAPAKTRKAKRKADDPSASCSATRGAAEMTRYKQRVDGEGFEVPSGVIYKIACCDCGLVHDFVFVSEDGKPIGIAARRNNRATAQRRRRLVQREIK